MFHVLTLGATMLGWHQMPTGLRSRHQEGIKPVSKPFKHGSGFMMSIL